MKGHPYKNRPPHCFWKKTMQQEKRAIDPVVNFAFQIDDQTKVATAGSCFAQHISRYLQAQRLNYLVTERPPPFFSTNLVEQYNYGTYTARYGNIYTTRQLLQLMQRAYGEFIPKENNWNARGRFWTDPFRPNIQPNGFFSEQELIADRAYHLSRVRKAFEELDVFVFTLGLTECWISKADGAVFPICPGVIDGVYSSTKYRFHNLGVDEVVKDFKAFYAMLKAINPTARCILTVSPVPLVATARDQHVWTSTTHSKSVLRVACDILASALEDVEYFPSYEIIMAPNSNYFSTDRRSVVEEGVRHVMFYFFKHVVTAKRELPPIEETPDYLDQMREVVEVLCDADELERDVD